MLSIFYRSTGPQTGQQESIKILNNVYLTISQPTFSSWGLYETPSARAMRSEGSQEESGEQTQMVLIKGKLGQFKAIWSCGVGFNQAKPTHVQRPRGVAETSETYETNGQERILKRSGREASMRAILLHDDKRFWVFQKEKKHFIFRLGPEATKKIEDRCFLGAKEQKNTYRD